MPERNKCVNTIKISNPLLLQTFNMTKENRLVKIYSGTEVSVNYLKGELEKQGIYSIVRNDYQAGLTAGFSGGVSSDIDLYIQNSDLQTAKPILKMVSDIQDN